MLQGVEKPKLPGWIALCIWELARNREFRRWWKRTDVQYLWSEWQSILCLYSTILQYSSPFSAPKSSVQQNKIEFPVCCGIVWNCLRIQIDEAMALGIDSLESLLDSESWHAVFLISKFAPCQSPHYWLCFSRSKKPQCAFDTLTISDTSLPTFSNWLWHEINEKARRSRALEMFSCRRNQPQGWPSFDCFSDSFFHWLFRG